MRYNQENGFNIGEKRALWRHDISEIDQIVLCGTIIDMFQVVQPRKIVEIKTFFALTSAPHVR